MKKMWIYWLLAFVLISMSFNAFGFVSPHVTEVVSVSHSAPVMDSIHTSNINEDGAVTIRTPIYHSSSSSIGVMESDDDSKSLMYIGLLLWFLMWIILFWYINR